METMSSFETFVIRRLKDKGLSLSEFSRIIKMSVSTVNHVTKGRRTPPLNHLPDWAAALSLTPGTAEYDYFFDLAAAAHIPTTGGARGRLLLLIDKYYNAETYDKTQAENTSGRYKHHERLRKIETLRNEFNQRLDEITDDESRD